MSSNVAFANSKRLADLAKSFTERGVGVEGEGSTWNASYFGYLCDAGLTPGKEQLYKQKT